MFDIGGPEFLMILVGALILFGPKKLPELAQTLGKGLRQFRRAQQEFNEQITSAMREEERSKNDEWSRPIEPETVARSKGEPRETPGLALEAAEKSSEETEVIPENDIAAGIPSQVIDDAEKSGDPPDEKQSDEMNEKKERKS